MPRVKGSTIHRARRKKVLDEAKGYFGSKHRLYKTAKEQVMQLVVKMKSVIQNLLMD